MKDQALFYDVRTDETVHVFADDIIYGYRINDKLFVTESNDTVKIWSHQDGTCLKMTLTNLACLDSISRQRPLSFISFNSGSEYIIVTDVGLVYLWDVHIDKAKRIYDLPNNTFFVAALKNRRFLAKSRGGKMTIWDFSNFPCLQPYINLFSLVEKHRAKPIRMSIAKEITGISKKRKINSGNVVDENIQFNSNKFIKVQHQNGGKIVEQDILIKLFAEGPRDIFRYVLTFI